MRAGPPGTTHCVRSILLGPLRSTTIELPEPHFPHSPFTSPRRCHTNAHSSFPMLPLFDVIAQLRIQLGKLELAYSKYVVRCVYNRTVNVKVYHVVAFLEHADNSLDCFRLPVAVFSEIKMLMKKQILHSHCSAPTPTHIFIREKWKRPKNQAYPTTTDNVTTANFCLIIKAKLFDKDLAEFYKMNFCISRCGNVVRISVTTQKLIM